MTTERTEKSHVWSEEARILPQDITLEELLEKLVAARVPVETYGQGIAKTVEHLLAEINEGEAKLSVDGEGNLQRLLDVLAIDVYCALSNGDIYVLKEDRQIFRDGRSKRRILDSSIGEKLEQGEEGLQAARRALQEELGIWEVEALHQGGLEEKTRHSSAFPGLKTTYRMQRFVAIIPEQAFDSQGYVEQQTDKTNYYVWELLHRGEV